MSRVSRQGLDMRGLWSSTGCTAPRCSGFILGYVWVGGAG